MNKKSDQSKIIPTADYVTFFYTDAEYHSSHPMLYHRHKDFAELIYVFEGSGSYKVDNRVYELKPGDLIVVDQNVWHGEEPFYNGHFITYTLGLNHLNQNGGSLDAIIKKNRRAVLEFEPGGALENIMRALYEIQQDPEADGRLCTYLTNAALSLTWTKLMTTRENEEKTEKKNDELIRVITEYLDEHYMEEINLKELGERFGLSHYYLAHMFKEETGVSPIKYVMHRKIGEAQNLLMNSDENIQEIGFKLGFSSSCHLSSVFKKYFGISPKTYRQYFRNDRLKEEAKR